MTLSAGVSSPEYFSGMLGLLRKDVPQPLHMAILEGYVSSMGMASESVVQSSRHALVGLAEQLPDASSEAYSIRDLGDALMDVLKEHLANDRVLLPLLESLAFLFDMQVLQRLEATDFKWRTLLSLVQKAHFKSTHMQKLLLSLDVYRGLANIGSIRTLVLTKVASLLLHPFPKV